MATAARIGLGITALAMALATTLPSVAIAQDQARTEAGLTPCPGEGGCPVEGGFYRILLPARAAIGPPRGAIMYFHGWQARPRRPWPIKDWSQLPSASALP